MARGIAQFISDKRAEGKTDSQITHILLDAGWHMDLIHKAMHTDLLHKRELKPILKKRNNHKQYIILALAVLFFVACAIYVLTSLRS